MKARMGRWVLAAVLAGASLPAAAVSCTASVPLLSFGNYDVFSASPLLSATTLTVTCSKTPSDPNGLVRVDYTITLATGLSMTYAQRKLGGVSDQLGYNLYTDSARTQIWGNGTGGSIVVTGTLNLTNGNPVLSNQHTVFASVPALQDVSVGAYSDAILVAVTY